MKHLNSSALGIAMAGASIMLGGASAWADDVPSNSVRLGSETVFYHTSADDLAGPFVPPGVNFKAQNLETLYMAYVRRLSSRFDVEFALGYPPLVKIKGSGPQELGSVPYNGQVVATSRWIAPTMFVEYKFMSENSRWRPYIGVGVNYTTFYDRNSTAQGNAISGGPTKLETTASLGVAGTVGVSYHVSGHFSVYGSYSAAQVKTSLAAYTAGEVRTTNLSFGPQVLVIAAGYSF